MLHYSSFLGDLKKIRQEKKISQEFLAGKIALGKDAYRKMESGSSPISLERIVLICEVLGVDFRDLIDQHLETKPSWEYEAEIARLQSNIHELQIERERLWVALNKSLKLLNPTDADEIYMFVQKGA